MLDALFLLLFLVLTAATVWASRSLATGAVLIAFGTAFTGTTLGVLTQFGFDWTYRTLQLWLACGLGATALLAWLTIGRYRRPDFDRRRALVVGLPALGLAAAFVITRMMAGDVGGPLAGVGYLVNHPIAEDNAKWLNTTAQLAGGGLVRPEYSVGTPLLMVLVVCATAVSVASLLIYGGVNQVAVAADSLILAQTLLVILASAAFSPLVDARWRLRAKAPDKHPVRPEQQAPTLAIWAGIGILAATSVLLTRYGHLTLQYTLLVLVLWVTCFLAPFHAPRIRLMACLVVATCAQVWFPLNILATALLTAALLWSIIRAAQAVRARQRPDLLSPALIISLGLLMFNYLRSSIDFTVGIPVTGSSSAVASAPGAGQELLPLFSIGGGTEVATPILIALTIVSFVSAASFLGRCGRGRSPSGFGSAIGSYLPIAPIVVLLGYAVAVALVDFWSTGTGPGYGSKKLGFAITIAVLASTIPLAVSRIDVGSRGTTPARLVTLAAIGMLLVADTLIPRALAEIRPQVWPAASPLNYWAPAEVQPTGAQPLADNPISCAFLTSAQPAPSALPKGQLAYSCTRLLTSLAGLEPVTGPLRDWLQEEWASNKPTWSANYLALRLTPGERTSILLDENAQPSQVTTWDEILRRYPPTELPQ